MPRLLLVDGHSNLYRAFYAIRAPLSAPNGTPTAATFGFLRMQHKLLRELDPTHVAVVFDVGGENFRTRMDARYKAHRPPMPAELEAQVPLTQEAVRQLGLAVLAEADVEADDVIATLATRAAAEGWDVVIASTDKDLMQLVRDPHVRMWHTRQERLLDEAGVEEVFGVRPDRVGEVLAIMGDSSDNVPGCPGIGEKGALELIRTWGSVDAAYAHLEELKPRHATALREHRPQVELSRELVQVRTDVSLPIELGALARHPIDREKLIPLYRTLNFGSLLAELAPLADESPATSGVEAGTASLEELRRWLESADGAAVAIDPAGVAVATPDRVLQTTGTVAEVAQLLAPTVGRLWCHDAKALHAFLRSAGAKPKEVATDAMLAGYLLAPGEGVDLATLCRRYAVAPPPTASAADRAAAIATLALKLQAGLERANVLSVLRELELPLVPVLEAMERCGILLDTAVLADLSRRLATSIGDLEREIVNEAGGPFNINSPGQLAEVLFERRGLPVLRRTQKTKAPSTDAEVLGELAARGYRLPALILEYREQTKLKSTYVDALPRQLAADGRIHTRFNQAVAATGRLSSSDPNLQNIPVRTELGRQVRQAFVAARGHVLLAADYSQIELRVLAHMSEDPALLAAFAAGDDIHTATAALVFGIAPALIGPDQRRAAKTINFGLIYGMGAFALAKELGVPTAEAQRFIDAYFERMPRVRAFLDGVKSEARASGRVKTLFGRIRPIAGLDSSNAQVRGNAERQAINAPVQGTAADLIKLAMIGLAAELARRSLPASLLLQVHDELVLEVEKGAEEAAAELVRSTMEHVHALRVPLAVDIGIGGSWAEAKG